MKTLTLTLLLANAALPVLAETPTGRHRMADGSWMADHDMPAPAAVSATATAPAGADILARVNGLVCDFCAQSIRKMLMKERGVADVRVDLSAKTVSIDLNDGAKLPEERLRSLLTAAGYDMTAYEVR